MTSPVEQFAHYPRQGNFEEKRRLILEQAARLFVEKGVHETSLNEIARLFNISKPALYHYASSKDDIIAQILLIARGINQAEVERVNREGGPGRDRLRSMLEWYGHSMATDISRCLATVQVSTFSAGTREIHRQTHRILLEGLSEMVELGVEDGSLKPCRPSTMVLAILQSLNGLARWYRPDGELTIEEATGEIIDVFMNGLAS